LQKQNNPKHLINRGRRRRRTHLRIESRHTTEK